MKRFDLCVIGSGPGGQKAAIQAAKLGKKVCIIERMEMVGGVAIHTGTIPSKALREAIIRTTSGRDQLWMMGDVRSGNINFKSLLESCQKIILAEMEIVQGHLKRNGVQVYTGQAQFQNESSVQVTNSNEEYTIYADKFIIATGTIPRRPADIPFDDDLVLTSDDLINLKRLPHSMIVLGGGVIGTEFATMFSRLGVKVTLVEKKQQILNFLDRQISEALQYHMRELGVTLRLGETVDNVLRSNIQCTDGMNLHDNVQVSLKSGKTIRADALLYCLGRQGATQNLNLEAVNISANGKGRIPVDSSYLTSNKNISAVGDVIGFPALASTSMDQGRVAACQAFDMPTTSCPSLFPIGIYSIPEISMVGDTEEELTQKGIPYEVGIARYKEIARGQLIGDDVGMLKILFHTTTQKLLGIHIIGTGATELIHIGQAVLALDGTLDYFVNTAFNYPTLAECYKVAALNGLNRL